MRLASFQAITLRTLAFVGLSVVFLVAASIAARQDPESNRQQKRPRKVGSTQTSNNNAQTSPPQTNSSGEEVGEGDIVRVETQLINVPAVVTDKNGHPLTGLRLDNFVVIEDGKPQQVTNFAMTDAPFEIALLLDTSVASMVARRDKRTERSALTTAWEYGFRARGPTRPRPGMTTERLTLFDRDAL